MLMTKKIKVLIIGGGFAGIKTVRNLYKNTDLDITLITDQETFRYGATIWRATTGYLKDTSYIPIIDLIPKGSNVALKIDRVVTIDRDNRRVVTSSGKNYSYDYCVIGLGVVTSYFGIDGLEKYSYSIKSSSGFDEFRNHLHDELTKENALDKNYVVVGAGPTGVELAAALKVYLKEIAGHHGIIKKKVNLELVEAAPRVLPMLLPKASLVTDKRLRSLGVRIMTGKTVKAETATSIKIDNSSIPTKTVIWTAGVTNNPFFTENANQFTMNEKKRVIVDEHLRVDEHTFVIGDSAATKFSGLALTALHNASYVSRYINHDIKNERIRNYRPLKPVTIIPVGENWSVFQWRRLVISGRLASHLRTVYDFIGYSEVMGVKAAWNVWVKRNKKQESCPDCKKFANEVK